MQKNFLRFQLLLDEGFFKRTKLETLNVRHYVKHVRFDLGYQGISDLEVYKIAEKENRLVVTFNFRHYRKFIERGDKSGVIGVSQNMTNSEIDKKLVSLLSKSKREDLYGRFVSLSGEGILKH